MNRRSSQLGLPGVAPLCPHCGGRRTEVAAAGDEGVVSGQRWTCRDCGRIFWSVPSLARPAGAP